ncbi:DUF3592 domain-containing protein [Streptomyces violaceusniger]|uniref:DUF3592 domain-containing protein n=1 Tax=Streptomyces violaceusniger TaxID=68280 RepID=UPI00099724F2|nr:DUF3592 domain-containing protein [Streptomyces hygroscopicus]AQW48458.1 hypothetical protein SHXM_01921 [Streptomyces hygroscopicus]
MAKRKKRPPDQWQRPPLSAHRQAVEAMVRDWRQCPPLPQRSHIAMGLAFALVTTGMFLAYWLPSKSLVDDLRSRGVTTVAEVTGRDNNPRSVQVEFDGPSGTVRTDLYDWGGVYPDVKVGDQLDVTYDREDSSRVLMRSWVDDPPTFSLPALGLLGMAPLFLAGTVVLTLRRRRILRTFGPSTPPSPTATAR